MAASGLPPDSQVGETTFTSVIIPPPFFILAGEGPGFFRVVAPTCHTTPLRNLTADNLRTYLVLEGFR